MEVLAQATELFQKIQGQIKKVEDIEKQNNEEVKVEIHCLKFSLIEDEQIASKIIQAIQNGTLNHEERHQLEEKIRILQEREAESERLITRLLYDVEEKEKFIKELKTDMEEVKQQLTETQNDLTTTQNDLTRTQNDLTKTQNDLTKTQNDLTKTQDGVMKMQNDQGALQYGQFAYNFQNDLATYICPHGKKIGSQMSLKSMEKWLEKNKEAEEGREANKRWNDLKKEFAWSQAHENALHLLVSSRNPVAHPAVIDLDSAESYIKGFGDEEKKCIEDIKRMHDQVNDLLME